MPDEKINEIDHDDQIVLDVAQYRDIWYSTSVALDAKQNKCAQQRFQNYKATPLEFKFPNVFDGQLSATNQSKKIKIRNYIKNYIKILTYIKSSICVFVIVITIENFLNVLERCL